MVVIDRSSPSNSQAFSGTEDRGRSDPSNEGRAFDAKLAQLQQKATGQLVRDKRQMSDITFRADGRVNIATSADSGFSTSSAEDVPESASATGADTAAADTDVATAGGDAAPRTTVSGPLDLGEGVTVQRLSAPVLEKGPSGSLVTQSKAVPLRASSQGPYLLSDKGAGAKPIAFRGTESKIYDTLEKNASKVIAYEPRKPGEDFAEASEGPRSIYAGFVADRGAARPPTMSGRDIALKVCRQVVGLSIRTGGFPSAEIAFDTPGHASQSLSSLFAKAGKSGSSLVSKLKQIKSQAPAAKDVASASQKTMLKISQYPEDGLTLVGTDSTTFGDIAETLRALPNRG